MGIYPSCISVSVPLLCTFLFSSLPNSVVLLQSFTALEDFHPVSFGRWRFSRVWWILPPSLLFTNLSSAQIRSRGLQSVFGVGAFPVLE